jgi:hypothetical protein
MTKKLKNKLQVTLILLITAFVNFVQASDTIPLPKPPQNGVGGPGDNPNVPIDMYQIALFISAVILVSYIYKKVRLSKV